MTTSNIIAKVGAAEQNRGVTISNTPPQNLHELPADPAAALEDRLTGGEDWFELMLYLRWDPARLEEVSEHLDAVKESVAEGKGDGWTHSLPGSGGLWKVEPHGCRLGDARKGPILRWKFSRDGIVFGLTRRPDPHKTLPSGFVRMTGDVLIAHGDAQALWLQVKEWFREMGAEVVTAKVSRVDMCVDLPNVRVEDFVDAYHADQFITRTKRSRQHAKHVDHGAQDITLEDEEDAEKTIPVEAYRSGRKWTGLRFGAGTQCRIYDKLAECRDLAKRAWLAKRRWGGMPDDATRVEFQLRRSFLTAEKCKPEDDGKLDRPVIDTVEDYFAHRAELADYLCSKWLKFFEPGFDPRQPSRGTTLAIWQRVAEDFKTWTGDPRPRRFLPMQRSKMPVEDLVKQAKGCMESAAARCGLFVEKADDLFYFTLEQLTPLYDEDEDLAEKVAKKMKTCIAPVDDAAEIPI